MSFVNEPIAIVGTGCRFPGDSTSPSRLWDLLSQPRDVQSKIDRFKAGNFYNADGHRHGTSNVRDAYLLTEDPRTFDAQFFNISSGEADSIDPQHRILLETVYESLESAGVSMESLRGSSTAVYVGVMCDDYTDIVYHDSENIPTYAATGSARSILSNRISYFFDWHGPSMTIDTACSSSLIAVHQAVQVLRTGESRVAVAGGANLIFGPKMFVAESNLSMLSATGRSQMWDSNANGYARGEGVGAVTMKTLSNAIADGDHIECIIRETGINQDGRTMGITMPSSDAQCALIQSTYAKAGLDLTNPADRCQYFEGDPQEARAIFNAFYAEESVRTPDNILHVGSIKTIVGHTEGTAGLAGVMKASLALQNKTIPPNLLFNNLNPDIEPFYAQLSIPTKAIPWPEVPEGSPRRASVNSFGFGGANAHAIIESYEPEVNQALVKNANAMTPFLFSAASEKTLERQMSNYLEFLKASPDVNLRDLSLTMSRRSALVARCAVSATSHDQLCHKIQAALDSQTNGGTLGLRSGIKSNRILGVFTGQGAQWATMGADLIKTCPSTAATFRELEASLNELPEGDRPSWSLTEEIRAKGDASRITQGIISQPACTAVQVALINLLAESGITFCAVVGHSSGEIAASYAAGFITARDAIRIAFYRGHYTKYARGPTGQPGAMMAAGTSLADAEELCALPTFAGRLSVAASNSSASVTLSGDADAVDEAEFILKDESKFARKLKVDTAYHSHHMLPCSSHYIQALKACNIEILTPPSTAAIWYSSVYDGQRMTIDHQQMLQGEYWMDNMLKSVRLSQALQAFLTSDEEEPSFALEVGPHPALKGPASLTIEENVRNGIPYCGVLSRGVNDVEAFADCLGTIWTHFTNSVVDFKQYDSLYSGSKAFSILKTAPKYAWDKDKLHWSESRSSKAFRHRKTAHHELLGSRLHDDSEEEFNWRNHMKPSDTTWLRGHDLQGQKLFPAAGYAMMAIEASKEMTGSAPVLLLELEDFRIHQAMAFIDEVAGVETLVKLSEVKRETVGTESIAMAKFSCFACLNKEQGTFTLTSSAIVRVLLGEPHPSALPPRIESKIDMNSVDVDDFYDSLVKVGYNYGGVFRGISSLKRTKDISSGVLHSESAEGMLQPYTFHPAPLDVAFQAVFAAIGSPGDGMLWTIHVPTVVKRISINPCGVPPNGGLDASLPFDAYLEHTDSTGVSADVSIYDASGTNTIVQIESLHVTPLSAATTANDKNMFQHDSWDVCFPDAELVSDQFSMGASDVEKATIIERTCLFYIKQLLESISEDDRDSCDAHQTRVLEWAEHVLGLVKEGRHPTLSTEWLEDTEVRPNADASKLGLERDLDLIQMIGEKLVPFIRSEISVEELYEDADVFNHLHRDIAGIEEYRRFLGLAVKQIAHRHQNLTVLQIGSAISGSGIDTTKAVLDSVQDNFSYYTYTDATNEFFQEAADTFKAHEKKFIYKTLDTEIDLASQGFKEGTYDLIVASNLLHESRNINETMQRVRHLLRPGGYLAMVETTNTESIHTNFLMSGLPDYWDFDDDKRIFSPLINQHEWDEILSTASFGGIDSTTPELPLAPFSVILAQAVDTQINMMRRPLLSVPTTPTIDNLVLVGGTKLSTARLRDNTRDLLSAYTKETTVIESLQHLDPSVLPSEATVICFAELDQPLFNPFTPQKLQSLQHLVEKSKHVLWVVQGAAGENPYANMIVGVARCLTGETPYLRWQTLDFNMDDKPDATMIAEELMRLKIWGQWNALGYEPLWTMETELRSSKGRQYTPRCVGYPGPIDRYNSSKREIRKSLPVGSSTVGIVSRGAGYEVQEQISAVRQHASIEDYSFVNINVRKSSWNAFRIADAGFFHLVFGTIAGTRRSVLAFSDSHLSTVTVPSNWTVSCEVDEEKALDFFQLMIREIIAYTTLNDLKQRHSALVHEPEASLAVELRQRAEESGLSLTMTTCDPKRTDCQYIHPSAPIRTLHASLPTQLTAFFDLSEQCGAHAMNKRLSQMLPKDCVRVDYTHLMRTPALVKPDYNSDRIWSTLSNLQARAMANLASRTGFENTEIELANVPSTARTGFCTTVKWDAAPSVSVRVIPAEDTFTMRGDKTYFMVGLAGSLGLSLCRFMIEHGARYFALTSRNPKVSEEWLDQMKKMGAVVKLYPMDVTKKSSIESVVHQIRHEMPPIAGVANGAMILIDSLLSSHTYEKFSTTLAAKVDGTKYLDEIFTEKDLDFFMAFSSLAFCSGNFGQTSYAAANGYMTALVEGRRKRGLAGCVMHLAGIFGVGYVERTDRKIMSHLEKYGMHNMSEWDFHQFFAECVASGRPESGLSADIASTLSTFDPTKDEHVPAWIVSPRYGHFKYIRREDTEAEGDGQATTSVRPRLAEQTTEGGVYDALMEGLKNQLAKQLQLPSAGEISPDQAVVELGVDSLSAVDLRAWFTKELDMDMPVLKILGGATLAEVVTDAVKRLSKELTPNLATSGQSAAAGEEAEGTSKDVKVAAEAEELDNSAELSPEEAEMPAQEIQDSAGTEEDDKSTSEESPSDQSSAEIGSPEWNAESSATSVTSEEIDDYSIAKEPPPNAHGGLLDGIMFGDDSADVPEEDRVVKVEKMSFASTRFWFLDQFLSDRTTFNLMFVMRFNGLVDVEKADDMVKALGQRHEVFRTTFYADQEHDNQPTQAVMAKSRMRMEKQTLGPEQDLKDEYNLRLKHEFDLQKGETGRMVLVTLPDNTHAMVILFHHIVMDGFSFNVLLSDMNKLYAGEELPSIDMTYSDFSAKQRAAVENGDLDGEIKFWKNEFPDYPNPLPLFPTAKVASRQPLHNYQYEEVRATVDAKTMFRIREMSKRSKGTTFHYFFAVMKIFMFRMLNVDDICIGMADANRTEAAVTNTIGFFLNLLPIRFKANEQQTFVEAITEVRTKAHAALANSRLPFDALLEHLSPPRGTEFSPIFQAFIDYRQFSGKAPAVLGKEAVNTSVVGRTAYDLVLDINDITDNDLQVTMRCQQYLYSQKTAQMLLDSYIRLVNLFASGRRVNLDKVPVYETRAIKTSLAAGRGRYMEPEWPATISHRIDDMASQYRSDIALKDNLGNQLTYSQSMQKVHLISNALLNAGVGNNHVVGVFQEPSIDWICSILAIWRLGATYVPLDIRNGIPRLQSIVKDANPTAIIYHDLSAEDMLQLEAENSTNINLSALDPVSGDYEVVNQAQPDGRAVIIYTSGSTGTPKGISLPHATIRNEMEGYSKEWNIGREVVLQQSAYSFDFSLDQILAAMANGGTLFVASRSARENPVEVAKIVATEGITYTKATPSEYTAWLGFAAEHLSTASAWKFAFGGGEAITRALMRDFKDLDLKGLKLLNSYGPAEATISCVKADLDYRTLADGDEEVAPAGYALPNYSLQVVDKNGEIVPFGVSGEILVGGAGVSMGYFNDPELTNAKFLQDSQATARFTKQGWTRVYRTGDKGYLREDGDLIIQGRIDGDTQIKLRGIRMELTDIENVILQTAGKSIDQVIVSLRGDPKFLVAHAKFAQHVPIVAQAKMGEELLSRLPLPQFMRPSVIIPVETFPLNNHNKTDRRAVGQLPLPKLEEFDDDELSETEKTLRDIWKSIVSDEIGEIVRIGKLTDFFQAGGNSLLLVKLQAMILDKFDVSLSIAKLFGTAMLQPMANLIETTETVNRIDWEAETAVSPKLLTQADNIEQVPASKDGQVVLLTGATGYLGERILNELIADDRVSKVHCVAVRSAAALETAIESSEKVNVHPGDLTKPMLGLSETDFTAMAQEVDVIVHSGANRAFWDQYHLLRAANVTSTKELALIASARKIPIHFLSSGGVMDFVNKDADISNSATSVRAHQPPTNGSAGYVASKWASEVYLENLQEQVGIPVQIHRVTPSTEDTASEIPTDVLEELGELAMQTKSLPVESNDWEGTFDLLPVQPLASKVVRSAVSEITSTSTSFMHYPSEVRLRMKDIMDEMKEHREITDGWDRVLPHIWIGKAKKMGFSYHIASNDVLIGGVLNLRR